MEPKNEPQLSRLLREWQVEDAPRALDARVLGRREAGWHFRIAPVRRLLAISPGVRKTLLAGTVVGMGALLIVVTQAIPQTLKLVSPTVPIPFSVDSEYFRYADDGFQTVEMYSTSYTDLNGAEVIVERTIADNPLGTAVGRTLDAILTGIGPSKKADKSKQSVPSIRVGVISGCGEWTCLTLDRWYFRRANDGPSAPCAAGSVVGRETILGYPTTAVESPVPNPRATPSRPAAARITMWMAPDLGCFALRILIEEQRPDGTFRLVSRKEALRVHVKP
jgi:hypothetical protein